MAVKIDENDYQEVDSKLIQGRKNSIISTLTKNSQNHPIVCGFPKNEIGMIIACSMVSFSCYLTATILGPFFPQEAKSRGLSETDIGIVIGSFAITSFMTTIICGRYISCIGAKVLLCYGMFLVGTAQLVFGSLYFISTSILFRNMCVLMRVLEGVGNSAATLASISIMAETFPHNLGLVISTVEVFAGLGGILGPFIGGLLFKFGGYIYPFYFCGILQLITLIVCIFTVKKSEKESAFGKLNYLKLLKFESIILCCLLTAFCGANIGVVDTGFALFLQEKFQLNEFQIGLCFVPSSVSYMLVGFLVGYLTDKSQYIGRATMVIGAIITIIVFYLIAPMPFLEKYYETTLPAIIFFQILYGVGLACSLLPAYNEMVLTARDNGFADSMKLFGLVSAVFNASYAAGEGLGPIIGGMLIDIVSFGYTMACFATALLVLTIIMFGYYAYDKYKPMPVDECNNEEVTEESAN